MNKKYVLSVYVIIILSLFLSACGATPASSVSVDRGAQFVQAYEQMEGKLPEMMEMPEDTVLDFYGIDPAEYSAALFRLSVDNMLADEVILIQAKDEPSATHIEEMLNGRLQAKAEEAESYSPDQYAIISKCSVYRDGLTLAMIVNANAEEMLTVFQQAIA